MIALRQNIIWIAVLVVIALAPKAEAQGPLERAEALYASARFADALQILTKVRPSTRAETVATAKTRALCLIALGRAEEAEGAFETLVEADPAARLTEEEVSPRVRALFGEVRRRMLPALVKERFTAAKALYTTGKREEAVAVFKELRLLLDDSDLAKTNVAGVSDLRVLVDGFLALTAMADEASSSAPAAARAPAPDEAPAAAPGAARETAAPDLVLAASEPVTRGDGPDKPREESDRDASGAAGAAAKEKATDAAADAPPRAARTPTPPAIVPPVVISQQVPPPRGITLGRQPAKLTLEVLIDEQGRVERASVTESLHPIYDALVLDAAEDWQYKPATRDGQPVKFLKTIEITVRP